MLAKIRNSRLAKYFSAFLALQLLVGLFPPAVMALTSGPSQPEVQSFEPIATTDMVDPFTGDFNYNVPLMQVGNYPINMFYHAGVGMDDEASYVGLGWNINAGNITRGMRGLPDDFMGDEILTDQTMKPNETYKLDYGLNLELLGMEYDTDAEKLALHNANTDNDEQTLNASLYYNTYRGLGYSIGPSLKYGAFSTNLGFDSQSGFDVDLSLEANFIKKENQDSPGKVYKLGASIGYNSRGGLGVLSLTYAQHNKEPQNGTDKAKRRAQRNNSLMGGTASMSFSTPTYTPSFTPWMTNFSFSAGVKLGLETSGWTNKTKLGVGYSVSNFRKNKISHKTLGYLYSGSADDIGDDAAEDYTNSGTMMDFNRDREPDLNKKTEWLHTTNFSYDVFSVAGQGTGGTFRPYRNSIGAVSDPVSRTFNISNVGLNAELAGAPSVAEVGADISMGSYYGFSKPWVESVNLKFTNERNTTVYHEPLDEPAYFKMIGEMNVNDQAFYDQFGDDRAVKLMLQDKSSLLDEFDVKDDDNNITFTTPITRNGRDKRNQCISYLTADEVTRFGLEKMPKYYVPDGLGGYTPAYLNRLDPDKGRKKHHIAEVTVINADGTRYVYGIAAYNNEQSEYSFSVDGTESGHPQNINYEGDDMSLDNKKGKDHYYKKQTTPAYAHTYLLTAVLSPDYVDITGNGPSEDDLGTYSKINYLRQYDNYGWRTPYAKDVASYSRGMMSEKRDDKASVIYGTKEIWYIHSIESKTQVAQFKYSTRNDSHGAANVNGGINIAQPLLKMDEISLFSKTDINNYNQSDPTPAFPPLPIKTAHFEYDYSLCKNVPNNKYAIYYLNNGTADTIHNHYQETPMDSEVQKSLSGKLTLKKLYFTYGRNTSGSLNSYKFDYGTDTADDNEANEDYKDKHTDRWGNYKDKITNGDLDLYPWDHPYADQALDEETNAKQARMWNLTKIELPSGGIIRADYEKDNYKFVQDKKAMQMVQVLGISSSEEFNPSNELYHIAGLDYVQNQYLHVKLPGLANTQEELDEYLKGIKKLYFTFKTYLKNDKEPEIVTGYADVEAYGLSNAGDDIAWIKISLVTEHGRDVNPVTISAWQLTRNIRPDLVYPGADLNTDGFGFMDVANLITANVQDLVGMIVGIKTKMLGLKIAKQVDLRQCFVRVNSKQTGENAGKYGGGYRIKSILFEDKWNNMTGNAEDDMVYGQDFQYKLPDGTTSGVAAYEPIIGGDENALRMPLFSNSINQTLGPDERFYVDGPLGEQFYPAPVVGYSRVIIKNRKPVNTDVPEGSLKRHGTGKTIHEFYTAYDFPVLSEHEDIGTSFSDNINIMSLLGVVSTNWGTATQGFSITTNDMHGKPKSVAAYAETEDDELVADDALVSKTEYLYKRNGNKLINKVTTINKNGSISENEVGKEIEMVVDTKHKMDFTFNVGVKLNIDVSATSIPWPSFTGFPSLNFTKNDVRFASCTKVVQRYGILETVVVTEHGSSLSTNNVLYDAETGNVLLTRTQNEFKDNTYNFTMPAHWAYDNMGPAYKNVGAYGNITLANESGGTVATSDPLDNIFVPGDEVYFSDETDYISPKNAFFKAWVLDVDKSTHKISFIDADGKPLIPNLLDAGTYNFKIVRSGRRNQQALPVASFISRERPYDTSLDLDVAKKIINASATEYSDHWQMYNAYVGAGEDVDYYACNEKGNNLINFLNYSEQASPNAYGATTYTSVPVLQTIANNLASWVPTTPNLNANGHFKVEDGELLMTISWSDLGGCSASVLHIKCLDADNPFIESNGYYNSIVNYSGGGYLTAAEYATYSAYGTDRMVAFRAETNTGQCYRFVAYFDDEDDCFGISDGCVTESVKACPSFSLELGCSGPINNGMSYYAPAKFVNPYQKAIRGIWRPLRSYAYNSSRNYTGNYMGGTTQTNIRVDGTYNDFTPFWTLSGDEDWLPTGNTSNKWVWTEEVTKVSPFGFDVENKDALNRYSAAVYGYSNSLPIITGSNAKYNELAYDGFEDYDFSQILLHFNLCLPKDHFSFKDVISEGDLVSGIAHTGNKSIKVEPGDNPTAERYIKEVFSSNDDNDGFITRYNVQPTDTLSLFSPQTGKYIISAWVKAGDDATLEHTNILVEVVDNITPTPLLLNYTIEAQTSQPTIEGWKRMEGTFTIPADALVTSSSAIKISLVNASENAGPVYYDDIRIIPFNSSAKSYIYDPVRLRLVAQLDENNYATFYEYDDQGNLIRVKRETERGIMTIQENRQNIKKQP